MARQRLWFLILDMHVQISKLQEVHLVTNCITVRGKRLAHFSTIWQRQATLTAGTMAKSFTGCRLHAALLVHKQAPAVHTIPYHAAARRCL